MLGPRQCGKWPLDEHVGRRAFKGTPNPMANSARPGRLCLIIWLVHPPVLSWVLRFALDRGARGGLPA